jgi:hypothetical protein
VGPKPCCVAPSYLKEPELPSQISEGALGVRSYRLRSFQALSLINGGEFLRLCGEFLRRNGEILRHALCKAMISNAYSAPESRRIMNLLERGGTIKIVLAVFLFGKGLHIPFVFSRCIRQAGL